MIFLRFPVSSHMDVILTPPKAFFVPTGMGIENEIGTMHYDVLKRGKNFGTVNTLCNEYPEIINNKLLKVLFGITN